MNKRKMLESERSLNFSLKPVVNYGGNRPLPYNDGSCTYHSYINAKNFMMLDVLTSKVREFWKRGGLYEDNPFKVITNNGGFFIVLDKDCLYQFPFLRKYKYHELKNMIHTSNVELSNLEIRMRMKDEEKKIFYNRSMIFNGTPEKLFHLREIEDKLKITFKSNLGCIFVNNILLKNLDYYPVVLYYASNSTQNFYRKLFLHKWKSKTITFSRNTVKQKLNLKTTNNYLVDKSIESSLDELKKYKLIRDYKIITFRKIKEYNISIK